eukprot:superscaffoldBa00001158_g9246
MGRKCAYPECKSTDGLHSLPSDREVAHCWLQALGRADIPSASVYVCNLHFTRECFSNYGEVEMGFKKQLLLKPDAVPTPAKIVTPGRVEESEAQASTSQQTSTTHSTPQYRHKGCQTDPEPTVSVSTQFCPLMLSVGTQMYYSPSTKSAATQLSYGTLKQHVRSKATQVREPRMRNCGVGTLTFPLDSPLLFLQPTIVDRPAKRPRLSLTDEEEGPSECSLSVLVQEPKDST